MLSWVAMFEQIQRRFDSSNDQYVGFTPSDVDSMINLLMPVIEGFEGLKDDDGNDVNPKDLSDQDLKSLLLQVDFNTLVELCQLIPGIGRLKPQEKKV